MKVRATAEYKNIGVTDMELARIPEEGEIFEVSEERFNFLNGNNPYHAIFVEEVVQRRTVIEKDTVEEIIPRRKKKNDL